MNLGTAASPSMLYVKGEYDPDSLFRGLAVDGSNPITGYGILVVEDSDLAFFQTGQFRWNGIILVTGRNNSTAFLGNSNTRDPGRPHRQRDQPARGERLLGVRGQDGRHHADPGQQGKHRPRADGAVQHADLRIPRELGVRRLLLLAALLLAACQQPPALQAPVTSAVSPAAQLRAEGDALMAGGNYAGAVEKFRQAIDLEPASVPLRFALGSAYSFLDRRLEAITQFRWVMANSEVGSQGARGIPPLAGAGRAPWSKRGVATAKAESTPEEAKKVDPAAQGSIKGQTQWPGVTPAEHKVRLRVSMLGTEDETRGVQRRTELLLGESFEFKEIPEGPYRVVGIHDDRIIWDQRITVKGGKQTDLAWSQADSSVPVNTFPPARR